MNDNFLTHTLEWEPGKEGKGFLVKPTADGIRQFPQLANAQPLVWTWPTYDLRPTHAQTAWRTTTQAPQGFEPDKTSYFHIKPDGEIWFYGAGRKLSDEDYGTIAQAEPRLRPPGSPAPRVEPDSYGHANRLLEILGGTRLGRWIEWPQRWRSSRKSEPR